MNQTSTTAATRNHHPSTSRGNGGHRRGGDLSTCCFGDMMDTLFVLGQESRLRILQQAASRVPGCAYLCVWAPIPAAGHPAPSTAASRGQRQLLCLDACLRDGGSGDVDRARALFDAYRGSLCAAVSGCVPGWAYGDGRPYMELPEHDLAASASSPVQLQFYLEAGIKVAAFMGCESGEIEVGMRTPAGAGQMNLRAGLDHIFSEDFFQQSLLEELLHLPPTRPSSSSSSLPSISVGSPADGSTSLLRNMATISSSTTTSPRELAASLLHPPHPVPFSRHGPAHVHFPSAEADDVAMAQAMLAVISASSSSSLSLPTTSTPPLGYRPAHRSPRRGSATTAFRAYNAALAPRVPRRASGAPGQRMIKMGISILRRMRMLKNNGQERTTEAMTHRWPAEEDEEAAAPAAPTSSQLHHMISERRRRERLNESFEALRGLLPPGSKKDKATVLANTLDYMNVLITQICELEAKNRRLEAAAQMQQHQRILNGNSRDRERPDQTLLRPGGSSKRVQVEVATGSSAGASTSSSAAQHRDVTITVAAAGDLSDLVARVLALLKDTAGHRFTLLAIDARQPPSPSTGDDGIAQASLTLRATADGEFEEVALKEAVTKAVMGVL